MDCAKLGALIRRLRLQKGLTQRQVAAALCLSEQAVSKWERGLGAPDISLIADLSELLEVNLKDMLNGELDEMETAGANLKELAYYVCPHCGNVIVCTGEPQITCCGRVLKPLEAKKATENERLHLERVEDEWYITCDHAMTKDDYIAFTAFAEGSRVEVIRHFPEWDLERHLPCRCHGKLLWYSEKNGLRYQLI